MSLGEQETCAVLNANPARREQSAFVESGREPLANAAYHTTDRSMPAALIAAVPDLVGTNFADPCYGRGCLADALEGLGLRCTFKSDIAPAGPDILARDLLALEALPEGTQGIITNLPSHGDGSLSTALARRALSLIRPGGYLA